MATLCLRPLKRDVREHQPPLSAKLRLWPGGDVFVQVGVIACGTTESVCVFHMNVKGIQPTGELSHIRRFWCGIAMLAPLLSLRAVAEVDQFAPGIDVHYKLTPDVRVSFQAKESREGGDPVQAEIGPSIELYLKPLIRLKNITAFDLDDPKSRALVLSLGYRYLASPNSPSVNRIEPSQLFTFLSEWVSCSLTGTEQTSIGRAAISCGDTATVCNSKKGLRFTVITLHLTPASSFFIKAIREME
jgi:hypothetical protein